MDLSMIGHMTKKLLTFEILENSLKIVWSENETTKGCETCMHRQWTLWKGFQDDRSHDQKATEVWTFKNPSTIMWNVNEQNKGCATCMHSQWTF